MIQVLLQPKFPGLDPVQEIKRMLIEGEFDPNRNKKNVTLNIKWAPTSGGRLLRLAKGLGGYAFSYTREYQVKLAAQRMRMKPFKLEIKRQRENMPLLGGEDFYALLTIPSMKQITTEYLKKKVKNLVTNLLEEMESFSPDEYNMYLKIGNRMIVVSGGYAFPMEDLFRQKGFFEKMFSGGEANMRVRDMKEFVPYIAEREEKSQTRKVIERLINGRSSNNDKDKGKTKAKVKDSSWEKYNRLLKSQSSTKYNASNNRNRNKYSPRAENVIAFGSDGTLVTRASKIAALKQPPKSGWSLFGKPKNRTANIGKMQKEMEALGRSMGGTIVPTLNRPVPKKTGAKNNFGLNMAKSQIQRTGAMTTNNLNTTRKPETVNQLRASMKGIETPDERRARLQKENQERRRLEVQKEMQELYIEPRTVLVNRKSKNTLSPFGTRRVQNNLNRMKEKYYTNFAPGFSGTPGGRRMVESASARNRMETFKNLQTQHRAGKVAVNAAAEAKNKIYWDPLKQNKSRLSRLQKLNENVSKRMLMTNAPSRVIVRPPNLLTPANPVKIPPPNPAKIPPPSGNANHQRRKAEIMSLYPPQYPANWVKF
jgi:hypothetical protein